jgi:hypothetical protein
MLTRTLRVMIAALLLAGGGWVVHAAPGSGSPSGRAEREGPDGQATEATQVARVAVRTAARGRCNGLTRKEVRGEEPTYTKKKLAVFRNHRTICRGVWLPRPRQLLVPQGLALSGGAAWVSGYRYRKGFGQRPCRLVRVDLTTGRRLSYHRTVKGQVGKRPRTYCRHGGGLVQRGRWLWLVEASKLWLVAPSRGGRDLEAQRVWRIEAPVRGSTIVMKKRSIGLVPFQKSGTPRIYWFSKKKLKRPGVLDLAVRSQGRHQLGAFSSTRIPRLVQGATIDSHDRLWLARSNLACGELVTPGGRRLAFVPGAEGIQFGRGSRRLWTVSESGSQPYATRLDKPFTPGVVGYAWPKLLHGKPAGCGFKAY